MTEKIDLGNGEWAEVRAGEEITGKDRRDWLLDVARARRKAAASAPAQYEPDPENPTLLRRLPPPPVDLEDDLEIQDKMVARIVKSWSLPYPMPFIPDYWAHLTARACVKLEAAAGAAVEEFTDEGPKAETTGTPSASTSPDGETSPPGPTPE